MTDLSCGGSGERAADWWSNRAASTGEVWRGRGWSWSSRRMWPQSSDQVDQSIESLIQVYIVDSPNKGGLDVREWKKNSYFRAFPSVQFTNTGIQIQIQIQIQIHKYCLWWSAKKYQHVPYFWLADIPKCSLKRGHLSHFGVTKNVTDFLLFCWFWINRLCF